VNVHAFVLFPPLEQGPDQTSTPSYIDRYSTLLNDGTRDRQADGLFPMKKL
jgi:hypothetical protein